MARLRKGEVVEPIDEYRHVGHEFRDEQLLEQDSLLRRAIHAPTEVVYSYLTCRLVGEHLLQMGRDRLLVRHPITEGDYKEGLTEPSSLTSFIVHQREAEWRHLASTIGRGSLS